jgi:hypothetical protein
LSDALRWLDVWELLRDLITNRPKDPRDMLGVIAVVLALATGTALVLLALPVEAWK